MRQKKHELVPAPRSRPGQFIDRLKEEAAHRIVTSQVHPIHGRSQLRYSGVAKAHGTHDEGDQHAWTVVY